MFEKFGEFDSYEEINRAAAAQKAEGDEEALIALAEENGIDREDAEDYMDGCMEELTTATLAAVGKLKIEKEDLKLEGFLVDIADELSAWCLDNENLAIAVRRKGMALAGYIARIIDGGFDQKIRVDKRIVDLTQRAKKIMNNNPLLGGSPTVRQRKEIAYKYYLGIGVRI